MFVLQFHDLTEKAILYWETNNSDGLLQKYKKRKFKIKIKETILKYNYVDLIGVKQTL